MRTTVILSLLLLSAGCASTAALENAQRNVAACEYHEARERAAGDPRAASTSASCAAWRTQVTLEQARLDDAHDNRQAAATVLSGLGNAHTAAGSSHSSTAVSCTSTNVGNMTFTNCN
jgi:hypothetical protein